MALPTMAQWTDKWAQLTVHESLGQLYQDHAHIFRALGLPSAIPKGQVKVNWTDGATADSVGTGAGAPQGTVVAAIVDDTFTKDFSAIGSQAYTQDIGIQMMGGGFEDQLSLQKCVSAIYDNWVEQLCSAATGADYALWGVENFFAQTAVIAAGMISAGGATFANLLTEIDIAVASLPQSGYNVCLTDKEGYNGVKKQVRSLGGTTPLHTSLQDFGFETLTYDGTIYFHTRHMADKGTCPTEDSDFYFFNVGVEGIQILAPGLEDIFEVQGPKTTAGTFSEVWDIALKSQMIYTSPRACYHLKNQNMN